MIAGRARRWAARWPGVLVLASGIVACSGPAEGEEPKGRGDPRAVDEAPKPKSKPPAPVDSPPAEAEAKTEAACEPVDPPPGLVDLATTLPTAIVVAGYHDADNFTGAPLPGYEARAAWLAEEPAVALVEVAAELEREGLRLLIHDGYRPRRASAAMVAWAESAGRRDLLAEGWVAERSAHNRGLAVDLGLADASGARLDMGSSWDHFGPSSHFRGVEGPALARRKRLRRAMVRAGFVPYAREWWHFAFPGPRRRALDRPYACAD